MNVTSHPLHCPGGLKPQVEITAENLFQAQASVNGGLEAACEALGSAFLLNEAW